MTIFPLMIKKANLCLCLGEENMNQKKFLQFKINKINDPK